MHHSIESVMSASTISIFPPSGAADRARRKADGRATVAVRLAAVRRTENMAVENCVCGRHCIPTAETMWLEEKGYSCFGERTPGRRSMQKSYREQIKRGKDADSVVTERERATTVNERVRVRQ